MYDELIKALRICANQTCCDNCPRYDIDHTQDAQRCCIQLINDAADALEAADKRIAELEAQNELKDGTITAMATDIGKLQAQLQKEGAWIETEMGFDSYAWVCSACEEPWVLNAGTPSENNMNYCPNCGARMKTVTDCHTLEDGER